MTDEERDAMITGISKNVNKLVTSVALHTDAIKRHEKLLNGNGQPGVCSRLQTLEDKHTNEEKNIGVIISLIMAGCAIIGVFWQLLK